MLANSESWSRAVQYTDCSGRKLCKQNPLISLQNMCVWVGEREREREKTKRSECVCVSVCKQNSLILERERREREKLRREQQREGESREEKISSEERREKETWVCVPEKPVKRGSVHASLKERVRENQ